jgi:hypothetical protein
MQHFSAVFPIDEADRDLLVKRYIKPIVDRSD